jgi:hypothetical protein
MRKVRIVLATALVALTASTLAFVGPAKGASGGIKGKPLEIVYLGERPSLASMARQASAAGIGSQSMTEAELRLLARRKHNVTKPLSPARSVPVVGWEIPRVDPVPVSTTATGRVASWEGTNQFDSRYSDGGNQFSGEPPDQGLCVGNGFVMETINSVIQVYDEQGNALLPGAPAFPGTEPVGVSLNQFYGYPSEFDRTRVKFGPFLFDVSCQYDEHSGRWFHLTDNLAQKRSTGDFTGVGSVDLAVSKSSNPLGGWRIYRINTVNDGTANTPDHDCAGGRCFADYPHIAIDANGVYITTNEYSFFEDGYTGAQLYALNKAQLVAGSPVPRTLHYENLAVPSLDQLGFTLRGALTRQASFTSAKGGTQYFLSSTAGDGSETGNTTGGSDRIVVWALTGTDRLNTRTGMPLLHQRVVRTLPYVHPMWALQKDGPTPLLDCQNIGVDCYGEPAPFVQEGPYPLDGSDTRVLSSAMADGVLWGTVATGLAGPGGSDYSATNDFAPTPVDQKVGLLYFAIRPRWDGDVLKATVAQQGYVGVSNANLLYPALAVDEDNVGFIGASLVGPSRYPSAVYAKVGLGTEPSVVRVAAAGGGPSDGFTGTWTGDFRPRWGDYSYAAPGPDGTIWFATEYVEDSCTLAEYEVDFTCGFERGFFANFSTRVTQLRP